MIASEPLTFEQKDWMEVKNNTMVVITPKVSDSPFPSVLEGGSFPLYNQMNLLQIPIVVSIYCVYREWTGALTCIFGRTNFMWLHGLRYAGRAIMLCRRGIMCELQAKLIKWKLSHNRRMHKIPSCNFCGNN